jgi:hypothetical protein
MEVHSAWLNHVCLLCVDGTDAGDASDAQMLCCMVDVPRNWWSKPSSDMFCVSLTMIAAAMLLQVLLPGLPGGPLESSQARLQGAGSTAAVTCQQQQQQQHSSTDSATLRCDRLFIDFATTREVAMPSAHITWHSGLPYVVCSACAMQQLWTL